ncbi:LCP family protein [Pontibacillus litoralis]|uniref:Uncharacterized protein n=1 Tax=Pontibacillus litoralis JSM 072002 TaxID=1385512 RepID=A0A0A5HRR8_9BACI|nr:hypothetical protein [Pontibacillus litoralis]KGX86327.1 hypothetical protein N784_05095 [Pontibacillus litoralis JSM 072002]
MRTRIKKSLFSIAILIFIIGITINENFWTDIQKESPPEEKETTDTISLVMVEEHSDSTPSVTMLTFHPAGTLYVSNIEKINGDLPTNDLVQTIENTINYPIDYYIRMDESIWEHPLVQSLQSSSLEEVMKQLQSPSLSTLSALTNLYNELETNMTVSDMLSLHADIDLPSLQIKQGFHFDTVPAWQELSNEEQQQVEQIIGW